MACDSQTLENLIHADGLDKLSQRDLLVVLASIYGSSAGFANAQLALNNAYAMGMPKLSEHDLWMALEAAICT